MDIIIWTSALIGAFCFTEFTAWFNHKYIMHGPLWFLHKDHHKKITNHGLKGMIHSL